MTNFRAGYIAIIGKPNVGKSTLINRILGQKLCITSRRPQTTRHRILGIKTDDKSQCIYVDTPGLHSQGENAMNRYMNRAASASIIDVDVVLFVVDGLSWQQEDEKVLQKIKTQARCPVMLLLNKVDKLDDKKRLLPYLKKVATYYDFAAIMPISARQGIQIKELEQALLAYLPVGELIYPEDQ
ncbi:MAG TPA: GTPase Era, partial [Gammaproteobacteria bacterium]|nr:GTPase Era [Gammaproteobacteria bacterium]